MNVRLIGTIILCLLVGFFISKYIIDQYQNNDDLTPVFSDVETVYAIQYGVYSSVDSMKENTKELTSYVYEDNNGLLHVYIGVTSSNFNLNKLNDYFRNYNFSTYTKELEIDNLLFLDSLKQYDLLLEKTTDPSSIKTVIDKVLEKYEELIGNG